uniref:A to I editase domain-containing protein n=1 Tax=Macrostomum lignano TaxID=282301 RepID=A0A1I8F8X6_9PLAT
LQLRNRKCQTAAFTVKTPVTQLNELPKARCVHGLAHLSQEAAYRPLDSASSSCSSCSCCYSTSAFRSWQLFPLRQPPQQQKGLPSGIRSLPQESCVNYLTSSGRTGSLFILWILGGSAGSDAEIRYAMRVVDGYAYTAAATRPRPAKRRPPPDEQSFADSWCSAWFADQFEQLASGLSERWPAAKSLAGNRHEPRTDLEPSADLTVSPQHLDASGSCLLDCHAEVLSRRCLLAIFSSSPAGHRYQEQTLNQFFSTGDNGSKFW